MKRPIALMFLAPAFASATDLPCMQAHPLASGAPCELIDPSCVPAAPGALQIADAYPGTR